MSNTIYLYLKTHNKSGLKYLGKTKRNPHTYRGSGLIWQRHIKKYGYDVTTEVLFESDNIETFKKVAFEYSKKLNIVESEEFANLTHEMGDGGSTNLNRKLSKHWKNNISKSVSQTRNNTQWKNSVGKEAIKKDLLKKNDPDWIEKIGKPSWEKIKQKVTETKNNPNWKKENSIECPHCHKIVDKGNYKRWHGEKCEVINPRISVPIKNIIMCPHCNKKGKDGSAMKRWHFDNCDRKIK